MSSHAASSSSSSSSSSLPSFFSSPQLLPAMMPAAVLRLTAVHVASPQPKFSAASAAAAASVTRALIAQMSPNGIQISIDGLHDILIFGERGQKNCR